MKPFRFSGIGLIVSFSGLIAGCDLADEAFGTVLVPVEVEIPGLPALWNDVLPGGTGIEYSVTVRDAARVEEFTVRPEAKNGTAGRFSCTVSPSSVVTMTAVPVILYGNSEYRLLPAGAVYPFDAAGKRKLRLDWKGGFSAAFLEKLAARSFPLRNFNIPRFLECVLNVGDGDPWIIDGDGLLASVLSGTMNSLDIRKRKTCSVSLDLPEGLWLENNVLREPVSSTGGSLVLEDAVPGMRILFRADSPAAASVYIDGRGKAMVRRDF